MPRPRERFVGPARLGVVCVLVLAACSPACSRTGEGNGGTPGEVPGAVREGSGRGRVLRVGNPSRGIEDQPDYDGMARELRARVADRLPDPLPPVREACRAMLDAALESYGRAEVDATSQIARLQATRDADQRACEKQTSPAAAVCVAIVAGEAGGEWPWLLDQCSRAFPRP